MVAESIVLTEAVKSSIAVIIAEIVAPKVKNLAQKMGLEYNKMLVPKYAMTLKGF